MTTRSAPGGEDVESLPQSHESVYEVFNPDHSVGVACDPGGAIVGLHIGEGVRENTDAWLAAEVVKVARLAYQKSQVGLRAAMVGNGILPHVIDVFGLPTQEQYTAMENVEFDESY